MFDRTTTIDAFLTATAIKQPTPGGGSVAALAGALAAAMGEMVLSYSIGKKDLLQHDAQLKQAAHDLQRARALLLELMVEDQAAYAALTAIRKLPADSAERKDRLPAAILTCIRGPQAIAAAAVAILGIANRIVDISTVYLLSDLAVCADLAMATVRCGIYNVRVNLGDVTAEEKAAFEKASTATLEHGLALIKEVSPRIWKRIDASAGK